MEALRETLIVAEQDLRHSVRTTKALAFLLIYALLTLGGGALMVEAAARTEQMAMEAAEKFGMSPEQAEAEKTEAKRKATVGALEWVMSDESEAEAQADYLLGCPLIVLIFFVVNILLLPFLIVLMTYDQISAELQYRSARYTLLRASRTSLLLGKILANGVLITAITVVTNLLLVTYAQVRLVEFELSSALVYVLRFWALTLPLALAWVSIIAFLSSLFRFSYQALMASLATFFATLVLLAMTLWESFDFLKYVLPWHYNGLLLSHRLGDQLLGTGVFLFIALLFGGAAWLVLKRRDV
ncbi:MAG: ABC transporter permease [Deltaproteobacteria bacterium]|nr:ABC transporter permease [Deltaproteobacteria bacterium]